MKKISFILICTAFTIGASAQQTEGKVIYQRTAQLQMTMNANDQMSQMLPKSRTDKFELTFGNNQSLWKHVDEDDAGDDVNTNGMQVKIMVAGQNDIVFHNFSTALKTEQREIMDKKFIVIDSIRKLNWKLTGETQTILGHVCQRAVAQRTGKRTVTNMNDGKIERKEINDTSNIIAWFTGDIPVPAGPEVQGQLPGLILALETSNGRVVYKALEISPKVDVTTIKEPTKGKKVTPDEFVKERNDMMAEMQKNNQGNGNSHIQIRN